MKHLVAAAVLLIFLTAACKSRSGDGEQTFDNVGWVGGPTATSAVRQADPTASPENPNLKLFEPVPEGNEAKRLKALEVAEEIARRLVEGDFDWLAQTVGWTSYYQFPEEARDAQARQIRSCQIQTQEPTRAVYVQGQGMGGLAGYIVAIPFFPSCPPLGQGNVLVVGVSFNEIGTPFVAEEDLKVITENALQEYLDEIAYHD